LGFKISLDDFGSGSTLMSYLTYLSPDQIKIDRSLVDCMFNNDIERKRNIARSMISSILNWADEMSSEIVDVVVEGIETDNELEQLTKIGVKVGQGFGLAKPMSVCRFQEIYWLSNQKEIVNS
jgi:EAL domain-containing protein (putative c-di-GMP-specific phosphodiesterase class I)